MFNDEPIPEDAKWWNKLKWWQKLFALWWCAWGALVIYSAMEVVIGWASLITLFWALATSVLVLLAFISIADTKTNQQRRYYLPIAIHQSDEGARAWGEAKHRLRLAKSILDKTRGMLSQGAKLSHDEIEKVQQEALQSLSTFLNELSSRTDQFLEFGLVSLLAGIDRSSQDPETLEKARQSIVESLLPHIQETNTALIDGRDLPFHILLLKQSALTKS